MRGGLRDGHRRDRVAPPRALEACLAWGWEGMRGLVAESKASSRRPLGGWLAHQGERITRVPRPCAVRQALAAWGRAPPTLPLWVEHPGRTPPEAPRRGPGHSVRPPVQGADSAGRVAQEALRGVVGHARQRAQPPTQTSAAAPGTEAEAGAAHVRQGQARWCAGRPAAETASAEYEGQGPGPRGRRPRPWREDTVRSRMAADPRRTRRARRGRPAKLAPPPRESGSRGAGEVEARANPAEAHGGPGRATTGSEANGAAVERLQASQDPNTTVAPGLRWLKHPAASAPVGWEKPAWIAA